METAYVVVDNEGSVIGVFINEEDAEACSEDYEFPSAVQGPFDVEESFMP